MNLAEYFEGTTGTGILSTASSDGAVNAAVYGRPRVVDAETVTFIMRERRTRQNLLSNPRAAFLFLEEGSKSRGIRLYLTMVREDSDPEAVRAASRREGHGSSDNGESRYLVFFRVDEVRPLIATTA
jgi:hypothetical protein